MKQRILTTMLIAAAMATAGCSKSDNPDPSTPDSYVPSTTPIGFDSAESSTEYDTKAVMSGTTLQVGDKIGLFGYCNEDPNKDVAIFQNQELVVGGTEGALTYTYSPIKYYPNEGTVRFFGYFPHSDQANATITVDNSTQGQPKLTYTPAGNASQQRNFLVADPILQGKDGGDVSLSLEHRMAKVIFSAAFTGDEGTEVKVKSITFIGYSGIGTFDGSGNFSWASDTEGDPFECTASLSEDELLDVTLNEYTAENLTYTLVSNNKESDNEIGTMLIPPQISIPDENPLSIKATLEVTTGTSTVVVAKLIEFTFDDYKTDDNNFLQELYTTNIQFQIAVGDIVSLDIGSINYEAFTTETLQDQTVE